ncbi:hypothetical protein V6N11_001867 [Hibiscus sabdariffa]|uniref:Uncharacterized protein n=1 Tax=Hibiscus sabdariffa TaxID=183260 RepID=A0ABR2QTP4_9ROSI
MIVVSMGEINNKENIPPFPSKTPTLILTKPLSSKNIKGRLRIPLQDITNLLPQIYSTPVQSDTTSQALVSQAKCREKRDENELGSSERNRTLGDSSSVFSRRRSSEKGSENINSLGDDSLMHSLLERRKLKMDVQLCDKILSAERIVIEEKECTADVVVKEERWAAVAKERLNDEDNDVGRGVEVELGENTGPVNGIQDNVSDQTLDDLRCMGFQLRESNSEYIELSNSNGSYCGGKSCRHEFVVSDKLTLKRGGD